MAFTTNTLRRLHDELRPLLPRWSFGSGAAHALLGNSENATFLVHEGERRAVVRVGRPGYHDEAAIRSELAWVAALAAEGEVRTARPLPAADGALILPVGAGGGHRAVAFEHLAGREPAPGEAELPRWFGALGGVTARLHRHARRWALPPGFRRRTWDVDAILGPAAPGLGPAAAWGDWRRAPGLDGAGRAVLERADRQLRREAASFGRGPDRFGLVHCDLRTTNLLIDGDRLGVIDFDDCGFSWFAYDFAAAVSFIEHEPIVPELRAAWLDGYRAVAPFPGDQERTLPALVMLRRMQLTAWIASRPEAQAARELGAVYARGTVALAEAFLVGG